MQGEGWGVTWLDYARWQDSLQEGSGEPWKDFKQEGDLI